MEASDLAEWLASAWSVAARGEKNDSGFVAVSLRTVWEAVFGSHRVSAWATERVVEESDSTWESDVLVGHARQMRHLPCRAWLIRGRGDVSCLYARAAAAGTRICRRLQGLEPREASHLTLRWLHR